MRTRSLILAVSAALGLTLLTACGQSADAEPAPLADPGSCAGARTTVLSLQPGLGPRTMVWHEGMVYGSMSTGGKNVLFGVPEWGTTPRTLADGWAQAMRVDGDHLVYATLDKVSSVRLTGGTPEVLIDAHLDAPSALLTPVLDGDTLFVLNQGYDHDGNKLVTVHRKRLADLDTTLMATMPTIEGTTVAGIAVIGDDVVVPYDTGTAFAIAKKGGPLRPLEGAYGMGLIGFDDEGPLWRMPLDANTFTIRRTSVLEGAHGDYWPKMPANFGPEKVVGLGNGFLTSGLEKFADGTFRTSMWTLDALHTHPTRIACEPDTMLEDAQAFAVSPDAIFVSIVRNADEASLRGWEIVRVAR